VYLPVQLCHLLPEEAELRCACGQHLLAVLSGLSAEPFGGV
jgi:hypothetical protein